MSLTETAASVPSARPARPLLRPAEAILWAMALAVAALLAVLALAFGRPVDWPALLAHMILGATLFALGLLARWRDAMERLALGSIALGFYMVFGKLVVVLAFLRFPLGGTIDPLLARLDAALGYRWPDAVALLAAHPGISRALAWTYQSALPQILVLIAVLAAMGRAAALHRMMLSGSLALLAAVAVWAVLPSLGPLTMYPIPAEVEAAAGLLADRGYAARLLELARVGPDSISPSTATGIVAFPSFHAVMACLVATYARGTPLFAPAVAVNALMIPATLAHGGHHLVDVLAGVALFAACAALAARVVRE